MVGIFFIFVSNFFQWYLFFKLQKQRCLNGNVIKEPYMNWHQILKRSYLYLQDKSQMRRYLWLSYLVVGIKVEFQSTHWAPQESTRLRASMESTVWSLAGNTQGSEHNSCTLSNQNISSSWSVATLLDGDSGYYLKLQCLVGFTSHWKICKYNKDSTRKFKGQNGRL